MLAQGPTLPVVGALSLGMKRPGRETRHLPHLLLCLRKTITIKSLFMHLPLFASIASIRSKQLHKDAQAKLRI
jgi:hypothetical protein